MERNEEPFKTCPSCPRVWQTREEFLSDPRIRLEGYQVNYMYLVEGLFIFTHDIPECGTSMALEAKQFADLYSGPIFQDRLDNTERCAGLCQHDGKLDPCRNKCECAFVREILQVVRHWKKAG